MVKNNNKIPNTRWPTPPPFSLAYNVYKSIYHFVNNKSYRDVRVGSVLDQQMDGLKLVGYDRFHEWGAAQPVQRVHIRA